MLSDNRESQCSVFFFFNDTATTEIYTLSLHDALPIFGHGAAVGVQRLRPAVVRIGRANVQTAQLESRTEQDRKSTRLNSSHGYISYAVFCLKKKNFALARRCGGAI